MLFGPAARPETQGSRVSLIREAEFVSHPVDSVDFEYGCQYAVDAAWGEGEFCAAVAALPV